MARKQATRELRTPIPVGIGAGITEKFYLQHLRNLYKECVHPSDRTHSFVISA